MTIPRASVAFPSRDGRFFFGETLTFDEFKKYAKLGTVVPVCRDLSADTLTPVTAFLRLRRSGSPAFLLESVEGGERLGRYSFLGRDPFQTLSATGGETTLERRGRRERLEEGFFKALARTAAGFRTAPVPGLPPLTGGAVGYIGYDAVRWIERLPDRHARDTALPDAEMRFYDALIAFDHAKHRLTLIANALVDPPDGSGRLEDAYAGAMRRLDDLAEALARPLPGIEVPQPILALPPGSVADGMASNFTRRGFEAAVERAREYIAAGDAFQIVLSQRFEREVSADPFQIYRSLRALNPSPYLFYLEWGEAALFGSSPETMVRVEGRRVMVRPIAGTRRRGASPEEDAALERDLLADEKELAEHRMLVDLGRNDVGRVARFGTVRVSRLEEIERYSHVMHIVSEVEGTLREDLGPVDAFTACFPAGTVSGAPKIRAMEIIDELEPTRRGTYAGAAGYLDFAGNLDTCIAIRTLLVHRGRATVQAGAGLVADSVPEREYFETIHKAGALYDAIRLAESRARA
jgi:anthranilate synthase component 1